MLTCYFAHVTNMCLVYCGRTCEHLFTKNKHAPSRVILHMLITRCTSFATRHTLSGGLPYVGEHVQLNM